MSKFYNRIKYCLTSQAFVVALFPPRDQQKTICMGRVAETKGSERDDVCIKSVNNSYPTQS